MLNFYVRYWYELKSNSNHQIEIRYNQQACVTERKSFSSYSEIKSNVILTPLQTVLDNSSIYKNHRHCNVTLLLKYNFPITTIDRPTVEVDRRTAEVPCLNSRNLLKFLFNAARALLQYLLFYFRSICQWPTNWIKYKNILNKEYYNERTWNKNTRRRNMILSKKRNAHIRFVYVFFCFRLIWMRFQI